MSSTQIFKFVYAGVALLATFVLMVRLMAGEWGWALLPLIVVMLCVYRLLTMRDE